MKCKNIQIIITLGCLLVGSAHAAGQHSTIGLEHIQVQDSWPGDMEGRTILSLALLEQSGQRKALYLPKMLDMTTSRLNSKGFFGKDFAPQRVQTTVPTRYGNIELLVTRNAAQGLELKLTVPQATQADVEIGIFKKTFSPGTHAFSVAHE